MYFVNFDVLNPFEVLHFYYLKKINVYFDKFGVLSPFKKLIVICPIC